MRYSFKARDIPVRWNHYRRAVFVSTCLGTVLVIILGISNESELLSHDWLIDCVACSGTIGHFLASSTYIARIIDLANKDIAELTRNEKIELALTLPFALIGLIVGIVLSVIQHSIVTFVSILNDVLLFTLRAIGAYSGIGNRLGSLPRRPAIEKTALILFTCLGLSVGIFLLCTGGMACLSVPGVSTLVVNSTIAKFLAIGYIASSYASAADYASKAYRFYRAITHYSMEKNDDTPEGKENTQIRERICEYAGSCFLALTGLLVAMVLLPHITSFWAATTVIISCVSIFGGIGSRLGTLADGYYEFAGTKENPINFDEVVPDSRSPTSRSTPFSVYNKLKSSPSAEQDIPLSHPSSPKTTPTESPTEAIIKYHSPTNLNVVISPDQNNVPVLCQLKTS